MNFAILAFSLAGAVLGAIILGRSLQTSSGTDANGLAERVSDKVHLKLQEALDGNSRLTRQEAEKNKDDLKESLSKSLKEVEEKIRLLTESNNEKQVKMIETLQVELEKVRKDNEAKLEQMRATVDEKLQGTLEKRLGESFTKVQEQLQAVHQGLGEMQNLATGVGDLKRVLTNVKNRGGWGEVQLARQLQDMLSPDQYEKNVMINPESRAIVEFAVLLPGRGEKVYIPIDSKFPQEDYERLLTAQEAGLMEEVEKAGQGIEKAVRQAAKDIADKYVCPPYSTDFAIMYLPTEGLFAEVLRRPGLQNEIQNKYRTVITGPTTLAAILNSLNVGFQSLKIEKRTSEVWRVLSSVQTEFKKYGAVWEKLEKQLSTAQNTVRGARVATHRVEKVLGRPEIINGNDSIEISQFNTISIAGTDFELLDDSELDADES